MFKVLALIASILYPVVIFISLFYFKASSRVLSFVLFIIGMVYFLANTNNVKGKGFRSIQLWITLVVATALALLTFITENTGFIKLYPVFINLFLFLSFFLTLHRPPNMIFRFAMLQDKSIKNNDNIDRIESYCRKVTYIWISFFVFNGCAAFVTAKFTSYKIWTFYNGLLSYIFIGLIGLIEFIVRKYKVKR